MNDFIIVTHTLPMYWASYLINGDATSLRDGEQEEIDAWLESEGNPWFVDVGEHYFSHRNDATRLGGNVAEYTAHLSNKEGHTQ
tara:strand:+ start:646 stop:897 length:252 start_codon:yes stop_codon:yes gene_type:complete